MERSGIEGTAVQEITDAGTVGEKGRGGGGLAQLLLSRPRPQPMK